MAGATSVFIRRTPRHHHTQISHLRTLLKRPVPFSGSMWRSRSVSTVSSAFRRAAHSSSLTGKVMAIRRETINVWERRAPLAPQHVAKLVRAGARVLVQPSNRRAFTHEEYLKAGAVIQEDLSEASLIIGVKAVPLDHECLMANKTYAFFSHTIKAQEENMPLLDTLLERNVRLIDYEKMLDSDGQRVVAFGQFAGIAGMIDILHGLGIRLLALGHHTPFMHIGPAHNYRSVGMAKQAIRDAGYNISLGNMPESIGPLVFVFTGSGNVSQGAQEMFYELPYELVQPDHLPEVFRKGDLRKIYGCIVSRNDHYQRRDGGGFDPEEFDEHPEKYISTFNKKIAPYTSVLVNGIYWAPKAPRLITIPDAKVLLQPEQSPWTRTSPGCPSLPHRLIAISDISADPGGSIEFMRECTTIDKPFCLYDAEENMSYEKFSGPGVLICSIDNMPAQLPREATEFFGGLLLPYVPAMLQSEATKPFEDFNVTPIVKNAVISTNGQLAPNFEYITQLRESLQKKSSMRLNAKSSSKSVLVLGSGYVVPPHIDYLLRSGDVRVSIVSNIKKDVMELADRFDNVCPEVYDIVKDSEEIENLVANHDITVSLMPYRFHPDVLKMCLRQKKHLVTASYCTPEIKELCGEAEKEGISVVKEVGLDPGIDHLLAMDTFDSVRDNGGKIVGVRSFAGGLPAPEFSNNPLRYKFSWSPEGVLMNVMKGARYLENGKIKEIRDGGELMLQNQEVDLLPGFHLEGYPNRDALPYIKLYGLDDVVNFIRGTYRYVGYCDVMWGISQIGLLSMEQDANLHPDGPEISWKEFLALSMNLRKDVFSGTLKDAVFQHLGQKKNQFQCLEELDLFSDEPIQKMGSPLMTFSKHLKDRLSFQTDERDVIIMANEVDVKWPDRTMERKTNRLVVYGEPNGYSAMAKTVGFPSGIAVRMLLDGELQRRGLVMPLSQEIYRPMLKRLKSENISAVETSTPIRV